jgi:hypothetical protein
MNLLEEYNQIPGYIRKTLLDDRRKTHNKTITNSGELIENYYNQIEQLD